MDPGIEVFIIVLISNIEGVGSWRRFILSKFSCCPIFGCSHLRKFSMYCIEFVCIEM